MRWERGGEGRGRPARQLLVEDRGGRTIEDAAQFLTKSVCICFSFPKQKKRQNAVARNSPDEELSFSKKKGDGLGPSRFSF